MAKQVPIKSQLLATIKDEDLDNPEFSESDNNGESGNSGHPQVQYRKFLTIEDQAALGKEHVDYLMKKKD